MSDFLLSVGVDIGLSYAQMQKDISSLVSQLNSKPASIKVKFDEASLNSMRTQLLDIIKSLKITGVSTNVDTAGVKGIASDMESVAANAERAANATRTVKTEFQSTQGAVKTLSGGSKEYYNALRQVQNLLTQVTSSQEKWTAAKKGKSSVSYNDLSIYASELTDLKTQLQTGAISVDQFNTRLAEIRANVTTASSQIRAAGEATQSWTQRVGALSAKFGTWFNITRVIMAAYRAVREMVSASIELQDAFTQLKIVTGATDAEMERFTATSVNLAKSLGKSVTEITNSIEVFSRLGYSLEDAAKLAEYATILSNVAAVDTNDATTGLTSIVKGFDLDVSETSHIADVLVSVGQEYAVSASELMEAYARCGAALNATNTSFEKSAGLIAAANASVQDASIVGTALKTVSARIRGSKTDLEELGETTEDLAEGFSKYAKEIKALTGFDIMIEGTTDQFKDIYDIFEGISQVWDKLSDTQQARVSEILGGTRQLQVISSIIGNWDDAAGAYARAMDSVGVATNANNIYMETATAHIQQFKATFEEFSSTLIQGSFVKDIVDFGTNLLNVLNTIAKIIDAIGGLNTVLMATVGIIATIKADVIFSFLNKALTGIGKIVPAIKTFKTMLLELPLAMRIAKSEGQGLAAAFDLVGISVSTAQIAVGAFMIVITLITGAISRYNQAQQEARDAAENLKNSYEKAIGTINDNLKTVEDLSDEFNSLSKGVGKHGENVSLTADEYSRYKEIVEQLVGINPDLVEGYDKENKAIINKNGAIERTIELLKTQQKLENEKNTSDDAIETYAKGLEDRFEKIKDKFNKNFEYEFISSNGEKYNRTEYGIAQWVGRLQGFMRSDLGDEIVDGKTFKKYWEMNSVQFLKGFDKFKKDWENAYNKSNLDKGIKYSALNNLQNSFNAVREKYGSAIDDLDDLSKSANSTLALVVQTADGYDKLTESQKGFVTQISQNFRIDFASNVDTFGEGMDDHVEEVQKQAEKLRTLVTAMSTDIELAVQFDIVTNIDENATVDEMTKIIQGVIDKIKNKPELKKYGVKKSELEEWFGLAHINEIEENLKERLSSVFKDANDKDLENKLGKLTEVQLENLYNAMSSADLSGFVSMDKAIDHFLRTVSNTQSLDELIKSLDEFKDKGFDEVAKGAEVFNSALQKLGENKTLSGEDVRKLIDLNADLADSFTATKDGFVIDSQKLVNAKQKYLQTTIDSINEEISANKLVAQSSKKSAEEQKQYIDMLNNQLSQVQRNNPTKAKELSDQLEVATQRYEEFNEEGKKANEQAEVLTAFLQIILQYLGMASDVSNQATKNYDLVNDYLKSQQDNIKQVVKGLEDEKKTQQSILDKLKEQKEELEKQKQTVEEIIADYKTAGSVVNKFIDERIESLNKQKTALEEEYEDETKRIEDRYDKELSALKSKNDEINKSIELKKAEDALYNAKNTQVRYYTGGGWNLGTNATEIAEKQQSLNALSRESRISALEKERDNALKGIENRKDNDSRLKNYESEIEQYEKYKEAFADMVDSYENEQNNLTAQRILGVGWQEKVLDKDSGLIADYGRRYNRYQHQLNIDITNAIKDKDREIEAQQKVIDAKQIEIDGWNEYSTELADYVEQISLSNESYINNLQGVEVDEKNVLDNRIHNLQEFKKNASKLLNINIDGEEVNGDSNGGNGYKSDSISMGGYHGSTNTEQTKKGSSYQLYFVNSDGNDEQLGMTGSLESMMKAKQTWIDKFVKSRNSSTDDELEKRFGYHGAKNAPNDGIRQFLNTKLRIRAFASGGTADFTDFIKIDGTPQKSETIFNSAQSKKLYDLVSDTTDLSKLIADRVSPTINRMIDSLAMNNTSMPQTIHNEFVFTGDIRAENYSEFEKCMNTYLQKVQMNIFTGR